ncbi:DUF1800 domain-containing protein [Alteromonas sp. P256]|uniref:DUF1800 domain-containing protein n=1 Tax=Alteromonas sp. P256 TaxID=3117399 RepID=UPI002FE07684
MLRLQWLLVLILLWLISACGGGEGSDDAVAEQVTAPIPAPSEPVSEPSGKFATPQSTSRFLTMATFGPKADEVAALTNTSPSEWMLDQFDKPITPFLLKVQNYFELGTRSAGMAADGFDQGATTWVFWQNAIHGEDQLRQRMAYALSQIMVVSNASGGLLGIFPQTVGYFQDILAEHALGNYQDLLTAVTYSPAMAEYLTYLGNQKGDKNTGRVPDENYAREILQLFTTGLVELNVDGTLSLDSQGNPVEIYDNNDITGLARVFTGLNDPRLDLERSIVGRLEIISQAVSQPLAIEEAQHSSLEKAFLNFTIAPDTPAEQSISLALEHIMSHPNVAPFVAKQLIQRFVTSNPRPQYVARVATAFNEGKFILPNGIEVGDGRKGDLKATISAVLFDPDTAEEFAFTNDEFGKIREPILRLSHFMRAFSTDMNNPEYVFQLYDTSSLSVLGQHPYRAPSVFNFYRPGYTAPGTLSAQSDLVAPELQIVNASSIPGYINLLSYGAFGSQRDNFNQMRPVFSRFLVPFDEARARASFVPNYSNVLPLADDATALVEYLNETLVYGSMSEASRQLLIQTLNAYPQEALIDSAGRERLIAYAVVMVMSTPDYLVQR